MVLNLRTLDRIQERIQERIQAQMAEDEAKEMVTENEAKRGKKKQQIAGSTDPTPKERAMKLPADQA